MTRVDAQHVAARSSRPAGGSFLVGGPNSPCFIGTIRLLIERLFVSLAELAAERQALDAQEAAWLTKVATSPTWMDNTASDRGHVLVELLHR
jgi:hypothetical protein